MEMIAAPWRARYD